VTAQAQSIIARVPSPSGSGGPLSVIRDGDQPAVGTWASTRQYDSWDGANAASEDWVGYTFSSAQTFTRVVFQEGMQFFDGGWFNSLTVQVRQGGQWVGVQSLVIAPAYARNNGVGFETYTLTFTPIQGDAIRIYGAPGGSAAFISVGELQVYVADAAPTGGTTAAAPAAADVAVAAQAQSIIARVPSPSGSGGPLSVIRDGDRPAVGTFASTRQYDSWDGANAASEDWVGYTFSSALTFTRVVFQEGMQFSDGGWFNSLTVQVRQGGLWVGVQSLVTTPAYARNNGVGFETYTLTFTPIQGDGIRIYGAPGGSAAFISVGELDVFGTGGTGGTTPKPDLTVASLSLSPTSASPGGTVNVSYTARNAGTATADSSAGIYLATSPTASLSSSTSLKTVNTSLGAGESTVVATSVTLPGVGSGSYYILVAMDPGGTLAESNETNNMASASLAVGQVAPSSGGITVWVTDPLTRVQPSDSPGTLQSASIKAARNEYEAFQLVVRAPSGSSLSNVNVVASDLVGPGRIGQGHIKLYRAHYVTVTTPTPSSPYPPGGAYADALIPFTHPETGQPLGGRFPAAPFPVSAGRNQPVWVDVYVPAGTPAGTYTGTVTVSASGVGSTTVPVTLTVWNFTLPTAATIKTAFGELWDWWKPFGLSPNSPEAGDIEWRFATTALAHRVTVSRPGRTLGWFAGDGTAQPADAQMRDWLDTRGATSWKIPEFFADPLGADRSKMVRYLQTLASYLASRGWMERAYLYPPFTDEPSSASAYQRIRDYAAMVHGANPNLQVLATEHHLTDASQIDSAIDIWVTHFQGFNQSRAQTRQAAGKQQWVYQNDAWGGSYMGWMVDYPILNYRVPHWVNWLTRVDGLLYWSMTAWGSISDPWTQTGTYSYGGMTMNGDGSLFYPGNAVGYQGPIASARLKVLRDGMEDYEYLRLLAQVAGASTADSMAKSVATSYSNWNKSAANLQTNREAIAQRIQSGQ
jgi:hypothetical protein